MKKRCTNSSCRKEFRPEGYPTTCPHCGKKYPRVCGDSYNGLMTVVLTDCMGSKLGAIKVIRKLTGLGLKDAKEIADHVPSVIGKKLPLQTAKDWQMQFRKAGYPAQIMTGKACKNRGVFVFGK